MESGSSKPDPQAKRVYDLEGSTFRAWYNHATSIHRLRVMAKAVCEHYQVEPVTMALLSPRGTDRGNYDDELLSVDLCQATGRNAWTLAHELAHHVCYQKHPLAHDHGPVWVRTFAEILEFLGIMPASAFKRIAREHKIRS